MSEATKKPSEAIAAREEELRTIGAREIRASLFGSSSDESFNEFYRNSVEGFRYRCANELAASAEALQEYLDAEAERRAAFEAEVMRRLPKPPLVISTEREWKDHYGEHSKPPFSDGAPAPLCFIPVAVATPCSERLPDPERRVLFFVPNHPYPGDGERRWRIGMYVCPPNYLETEWRDEESEVGDTGITWKLDQVTHWMPMPGEPSNA